MTRPTTHPTHTEAVADAAASSMRRGALTMTPALDDFPCCGKVPRSVRIITHGAPATQGSKKGFIRGRKVVMVEMDEKLPAWRATVEAAARQAAGPDWVTIDGAVSISGEIRLRKPKTTKYPDYPAGPPDTDKLQRAIGDALTKSQVITDDARIVHWNIRKVWAEDMPGMDIEIMELGGANVAHG